MKCLFTGYVQAFHIDWVKLELLGIVTFFENRLHIDWAAFQNCSTNFGKLKFSGMLVLAQNRFKRSGGLGKRQDSFHYETSNGLDLPQQENNVRRHRY